VQKRVSIAESATAEHKLANPLDATVNEVAGMGYPRAEVQAIVSWMWDMRLEYDNPGAVVEQLVLKQEQTAKEGDSAYSPTASQGDMADLQAHSAGEVFTLDNGDDEDEELEEGPESQYEVPNSMDIKEAVNSDSDDDDENDAGSIEANSVTPHSSDVAVTQQVVKQTETAAPGPAAPEELVPPPLHTRLEMAASHPNYVDALVALMAWSSMADPSSMTAFFESQALELLFENFITNCVDYASVHVNLFGFLNTILAAPSTKQCQLDIATLLDQLYAGMDSLQSVGRVTKVNPGVLRQLASRFASAVRAYRKAIQSLDPTGSRMTLGKIDGDLRGANERLRQLGTSEGVREAFIRRDLQHQATTLHYQACQTLLGGSCKEMVALGLASAEESQALMQALVSQEQSIAASAEGGTDILEKRRQMDQVRARLQALKVERDAETIPLRTEVNLCTEKLSALDSRKQELKLALKECEAEWDAVWARRTALEESIQCVIQTFDAETAQAESEQQTLVSVLRYAENCENLVQSVERFEKHVAQSVKIACEASQRAQISDINNRLAHLLMTMESYLSTEVKCAGLMKKRIELSENKLKSLEREINEYRTLGMIKMVDEIESTATKMRTNAAEDEACVQTITQMVDQTYQSLRSLLEEHGSGLLNLPFDLIVSIKRQLGSLGLAEDWDLSLLGIIEPVGSELGDEANLNQNHLSHIMDPPAVSPAAVLGAPLSVNSAVPALPSPSLGQAAVKTAVLEPQQVPKAKLSWASKAAFQTSEPSTGGGKKSLLEIQKEELEGRLTEENLKRLEQGKKPAFSPLLAKIDDKLNPAASASQDLKSAEADLPCKEQSPAPEVGVSSDLVEENEENDEEQPPDEPGPGEEAAPLEKRETRRRKPETPEVEES